MLRVRRWYATAILSAASAAWSGCSLGRRAQRNEGKEREESGRSKGGSTIRIWDNWTHSRGSMQVPDSL
eukprot:1890457-Pleurochrysis_carterae.AAC.1